MLFKKLDGEVVDITKLKKEELRKLRPQIQIIFQDPYSSLSPRMPVGEIIGEAVRVHNIVSKEEYKDYCRQLEIMGFNSSKYYYLYKFVLNLFGYKFCNKCVDIIKKIIGHRPKL